MNRRGFLRFLSAAPAAAAIVPLAVVRAPILADQAARPMAWYAAEFQFHADLIHPTPSEAGRQLSRLVLANLAREDADDGVLADLPHPFGGDP